MIKEKINKKKKKTVMMVLREYLRTIGFSFFIALFITTFLTFHARSEMLKTLYLSAAEQLKMDEKIAQELVSQSDLTKDLINKGYAVCMRVGKLYEIVHDYEHAQYAYELALEKYTSNGIQPYERLATVLIAQEKFDEADVIIAKVNDTYSKSLLKFKTRIFMAKGDKYYSIGKFISAAKSYEKAKFYYDKFKIKDNKVEKKLITRIVNSYVETASLMVKSGYNTEAIKYLKKAEEYQPENLDIKYRMAIIYTDLNPIKAVEIFDDLIYKIPQKIDNGAYSKALLKSATIKDLEKNSIEAKLYRYKIHSLDLFINQKIVYKNDFDTILISFELKKIFFKYKLKPTFKFINNSSNDISKLHADFNLRFGDKIVETKTINCIGDKKVLYSGGDSTKNITINFGENIFTKRELKYYYIDVYLYKDEKYKTLVSTIKLPDKSIKQEKDNLIY